MISQPVNVIPSLLSGVGDGIVDVTDGLHVSWQFSGTPMYAYKINIYLNDTASTQKYAGSWVELKDGDDNWTPFYPTDYKGDVVTFSEFSLTAEDLEDAGIINGKDANGYDTYKIVISMAYSADYATSSKYITQTSASVFRTRERPTLSINEIDNPYTSRSIDVTATYSQAQGDSIAWSRWMLMDYTNGEVVIKDTGAMETEVLMFKYDGLLNKTEYKVKLIIQTENGVRAETDWELINVDYVVISNASVVDICRPYNAPYVQVSWSSRTTIHGTAVEEATVEDGKLIVAQDNSVYWSEIQDERLISFPKPWTFAFRVTVKNVSESLTRVRLNWNNSTSEYVDFSIGDNKVSMETHDGETIFEEDGFPYGIKPKDTFVVIVTPDHYYIKQITYVGGLLPRTDLYPATNLYPQAIEKKIVNLDGAIAYTQKDIGNKITVVGEVVCDYLYLYSGVPDESVISNMLGTEWYEPQYDGRTYFIALFTDGTMDAQITGGNGDVLDGISIYRKDGSSGILKLITNISSDYSVFRDYGVKSNGTYQYVLFQRGKTKYVSEPYLSESIVTRFGTFALMECTEEESGVYHVDSCYIVAGNINEGTISNNSKSNVYENFTRYPMISTSSQLYKSGTITALIGTIENNKYEDSWELADKIMELSVSKKTKFLRDSKGGLWRIEPNGSITMSVEKSSVMPLKMSFPWIEVGDSDNISIVSLPTDEVWENDEIIDTSVELDLVTGHLYWTTHDDYKGSDLSILSSGHLLVTGTKLIEIADMKITEQGHLIATV